MSDPYTQKATNDKLTPQQKIDGLKEILATTKTGCSQRVGPMANCTPVQWLQRRLRVSTSHSSQITTATKPTRSKPIHNVTGTATLSQDREKIKKLWSPLTKAWFGDLGDGVHKGDENDPRVELIDVAPTEIRYWYSKQTKVSAAVEVVASAVTGKVATPGELRTITKQEH
ncbi:pyridoxamine 5'-phosphate oxidase family protein [Ceratobasidium sp. AG-Ba]|nr:pyridoxamine 5'-phosphate oxidase family protein [Ceratobasidium sp. AG-Ba]